MRDDTTEYCDRCHGDKGRDCICDGSAFASVAHPKTSALFESGEQRERFERIEHEYQILQDCGFSDVVELKEDQARLDRIESEYLTPRADCEYE